MAKEGKKPKAIGKKKAIENEKPQSERFIETARRLGVDESGKTFEDAVRKVLRPSKPANR